MTVLAERAMDTFDTREFRWVLGHFPTGVVVITGMDGDQPAGLAVNSFSSVSLDPPLVGFFVGRTSTSWPRIGRGGRFCVNVLAEQHEELCRVFSAPGGDKFSGVSWHLSSGGCPVVDGVTAWIDCVVHQTVPAGDHILVLGFVGQFGLEEPAQPLLFLRGGHPRLAAE
jgi:3-hydroxy-9,10-secoandrosta-1,3,5(10)-triene-9,17-dione monooxygenase reductase component